jgi:hypothetical protein
MAIGLEHINPDKVVLVMPEIQETKERENAS